IALLPAAHAARLPGDVRQALIDRFVKEIKDSRADAELRANPKLLDGQLKGMTTLGRLVTYTAEAGAAAGAKPDPVAEAARALVPIFESARTDKSVGASNTASGTTNLVSKGSIPSLLGFAVENGALSRTVSGTTVTFQGSPT